MMLFTQNENLGVLWETQEIRKGVNALNELNIDFEILHENYLGDEKIVFLKKKS